MNKIKQTSILSLVFLFLLSSTANAQFLGKIKSIGKQISAKEKNKSVDNSQGKWYAHVGLLSNRYTKFKNARHAIIGPNTISELRRMPNKFIFKVSTLVSKSNDPASFKPVMQYPELSEVTMELGEIPSVPAFYFSNEPIDPKNPEARAKNSFANNERIYGLIKYDRPLKDFLGADTSSLPDKPYLLFQYTLSPFQQLMSSAFTSNPMFIKKSELENDYLLFDVIPDPAKATREFRLYSLQGYLGNVKRYSKEDLKKYEPVNSVRIDIQGWNKTFSHQINIDLASYDTAQLEADAKKSKTNVLKK